MNTLANQQLLDLFQRIKGSQDRISHASVDDTEDVVTGEETIKITVCLRASKSELDAIVKMLRDSKAIDIRESMKVVAENS